MRAVYLATGVLLGMSGAAAAQEPWTFIQCEMQSRTTHDWRDGQPETSEANYRSVFRFNATGFDRYASGPVSWERLCEPAEAFQSAECTIDEDRLVSRRSGVANSEEQHTQSVILNRITGRVTVSYSVDIPGYLYTSEASGACELTTDPTAGVRRF